MREQLHLPTDRPIIMTGHQAAFWHPGILAKYLAADAAGRALGASPAWVVVDQDDPPAATTIAYPRLADERVERAELDLARSANPDPTGLPFVDDGLARISRAWSIHAREPGPARRVAGATAEIMTGLVPAAPTIFATELCRTALFARIIEAMREDGAACVAAYNGAVGAHPKTGIRALAAAPEKGRFELPLWRIKPGGERERVFASELDGVPIEELAPRALLLTGLLRLGACDLFIHGTGGGGDEEHEGYDRVTEDWLNAWPRAREWTAELGPLAPVATVSATLLLPLGGSTAPSESAAAQAAWKAHRSRHDPELVHEPGAAAEKQQLVAQIESAPRQSDQRARLFRRMHDLLDRVRGSHRSELETLDTDAKRERDRLAARAVLEDRTWPFPLYPESTLLALRAEIDAAFSVKR